MSMPTADADRCVTHSSGWVRDGHTIVWNGEWGAGFGHTNYCPFYMEGKFKIHMCSLGIWEQTFGVHLIDLPEDEANACREFDHGSEPIIYKYDEIIHLDMPVHEQYNLSSLHFRLDHEDYRND